MIVCLKKLDRKTTLFISHVASLGGATVSLFEVLKKIDKRKCRCVVVLPEKGSFCDLLEKEKKASNTAGKAFDAAGKTSDTIGLKNYVLGLTLGAGLFFSGMFYQQVNSMRVFYQASKYAMQKQVQQFQDYNEKKELVTRNKPPQKS